MFPWNLNNLKKKRAKCGPLQSNKLINLCFQFKRITDFEFATLF